MSGSGIAEFGYYYNTFTMPARNVTLSAICSTYVQPAPEPPEDRIIIWVEEENRDQWHEYYPDQYYPDQYYPDQYYPDQYYPDQYNYDPNFYNLIYPDQYYYYDQYNNLP